ncbi:MAG: hypothetical protein IPP90_04175 [Gemmatimonadaceae bacterium]|nr:hypothetical protein [Gemmatimonadaceae bacterium]
MINRAFRFLSLAVAAAVSQSATVQPGAVRQPPVLTVFALNDGAATSSPDATIVLSHTVVGTVPTSYRVSSRADFAGAAWLPYTRRPELVNVAGLSTLGCDVPGSVRRLRLFLQVRSTLGDEVRIVNGQRSLTPVVAESNVLADSICLVATKPE